MTGDPLKDAASDVRFLLDRRYQKDSAIRYVSDHYCLHREQRFILARIVLAKEKASARRKKLIPVEALKGEILHIDGYNVLISVESLIGGRPVYLCDDGLLRDSEGIFRSYGASRLTAQALDAVFDLLAPLRLARAEVLLDKQISMSGQLASFIRHTMAEKKVAGSARTAQDVDRQLKDANGAIATADGSIIDAADMVVDIPKEISVRRGIGLIVL